MACGSLPNLHHYFHVVIYECKLGSETTSEKTKLTKNKKNHAENEMIQSVNKENRFVLPTATSHEPEVSGNITVTTGCGQRDP